LVDMDKYKKRCGLCSHSIKKYYIEDDRTYTIRESNTCDLSLTRTRYVGDTKASCNNFAIDIRKLAKYLHRIETDSRYKLMNKRVIGPDPMRRRCGLCCSFVKQYSGFHYYIKGKCRRNIRGLVDHNEDACRKFRRSKKRVDAYMKKCR